MNKAALRILFAILLGIISIVGASPASASEPASAAMAERVARLYREGQAEFPRALFAPQIQIVHTPAHPLDSVFDREKFLSLLAVEITTYKAKLKDFRFNIIAVTPGDQSFLLEYVATGLTEDGKAWVFPVSIRFYLTDDLISKLHVTVSREALARAHVIFDPNVAVKTLK